MHYGIHLYVTNWNVSTITNKKIVMNLTICLQMKLKKYTGNSFGGYNLFS